MRWVQNGIFQPRFSIHSTNTDNTVTEPDVQRQKAVHQGGHRLPLQAQPDALLVMERAPQKRLPIWQPTFAVFQNDPQPTMRGVDFMFGDSLLVANVVEGPDCSPGLPAQDRKRERGGSTTYTPARNTPPGQTVEVPVDIASIPLFVRSGAIIPMSGNALHNLMTEKTTALDILMAPMWIPSSRCARDDGRTNDYRNGVPQDEDRCQGGRQNGRDLHERGQLRRPPWRACTLT